MSTISMILQTFKTKARSREEIMDFRMAFGEVERLSENSVEIPRGEDYTFAAERFVILVCSETIPMQLTTYHKSGNNWVANSAVSVEFKGVFSYPGKVSIYIENPSNNVSDLPYRFSAIHS